MIRGPRDDCHSGTTRGQTRDDSRKWKAASAAAALVVVVGCELLALSMNTLSTPTPAFAALPLASSRPQLTPSAASAYAVTLSATTATPAVGAPVTLTATANQDVGPTLYGISIFDQTSGSELVHGTAGTTLSTTVIQSVDSTRSYVAEICNVGGANVQATSTSVVVIWGAGSPPAVTGLAPASGDASGGTSIIVSGSNLTGTTSVSFGLTPARAFTVNSATSIAATSPAGSGTVDVVVTTPAGSSVTGSSDQFTYVPASNPPAATAPQPTFSPQAQPILAMAASPSPSTAAPAKAGPRAHTPSPRASSVKAPAATPTASSAADSPLLPLPEAKSLDVTAVRPTVVPSAQPQGVAAAPASSRSRGPLLALVAGPALALLAAGFLARRHVFAIKKK